MNVRNELKAMHKHMGTDKGVYGERAVLAICEQFYQKYGGILVHSYEYQVDPDLPGNIKKHDDGQLYIENLGTCTELDVLYVSPYRVFPIEVKSYKAKKITLTDDGISGCKITNKSPVHQNEMHCRHLYSFAYRFLPKGATKYICPIVCLVDECVLEDRRSMEQREYILATTLTNLTKVITMNNRPLDYRIDIDLADNILREYMTKSEVYLKKV